jgi:hypothetical protein
MFAAVRGYHTGQSGELITTIVQIGAEVSPKLTITKIIVVKPTEIEAFMASIDPAAFADVA